MEEAKDKVAKAALKLWETLGRHNAGDATEIEVADVFITFDEACANYAIELCSATERCPDRIPV
jgi:hypothetical protein